MDRTFYVRYSISGNYWYCSEPLISIRQMKKKEAVEVVKSYCRTMWRTYEVPSILKICKRNGLIEKTLKYGDINEASESSRYF